MRLKAWRRGATTAAPMGLLARRRRDWLLCAVVLVQLAYSWTCSRVSVPNERTRVYLTMAIVEQGRLAIDAQVRRFGRVYDLARYDGHYFTDKAPGASLLAVPIYAAARRLQPAVAHDVVDVINLARTYLMLPIGVLGFVVLRSLLRALGRSEASTDIAALGFSLGTPMLHYSAAFYGHAIVAVGWLLALRCQIAAGVLAHARAACSQRRRNALLLAAGGCAGAIGLTEYQAVVLSALLGLPLVWPAGSARRLRDLAWFCAGALPFAAALLAYDARAFGGPFSLSYQHLSGAGLQALHRAGLAGATWPRAHALWGLLLSAHRGLITTSPVLAVGLLGFGLGYRSMPRALWLTLGACVLYMLLIVASSSVWYGGWSFGPRLLVPIMGPLAICAAYALDALGERPLPRALCRGAVCLGLVYQPLVQITFAELPPEFLRPLPDAVVPQLHAHLIAPNLLCKWIPLAVGNLIPLFVLIAVTVAFVAFRGSARKPGFGLLSLASASLALWLLWAAPPSIDAAQQAAWLQRVRDWRDGEQRCVR